MSDKKQMTFAEVKAEVLKRLPSGVSFSIQVDYWDHRSGGEAFQFSIYDCTKHFYGKTIGEAFEEFNKVHPAPGELSHVEGQVAQTESFFTAASAE